MSTKATIVYGPGVHFYHEVLDDDYVYLELEAVPFEASYNRVVVPIPLHVWEVIRHYPGLDLAFADKGDDELRQYVEQRVDERIQAFREAEADGKGISRVAGALAYGTADLPREQQLEAGMQHFLKMRDHQRQIAQAIAELAQLNARA